MYKISKSGERGTTLVEAMVAVLILTVGIIPSLAIILLANSFSSSIKNNLIAAHLAQEGIEVVRAIRDNNWLNNRPFDDGLVPSSFDCTLGCRVEWNSNALLQESGNPVLKLNQTGLYNYSVGIDTNFRRRVTITKILTSELNVIVEVIWTERGKTQIINVESHLYNWR